MESGVINGNSASNLKNILKKKSKIGKIKLGIIGIDGVQYNNNVLEVLES